MAVVRFTLILLTLLAGISTAVRADFAEDLARIHVEAVGGRKRVDALKTLKVTGITRNESGELHFILWAARPNLVRTEVTSGLRTIIQAWDGKGDPWMVDSRTEGTTTLTGGRAEEFKAEAEFDDPLLAGADRRVSLDYSGTVEVDGRELLKIWVTQNLTENSFVYLDPATYLIVRRDVIRRRDGEDVVLRTDYGDFRPVAGVILPHRLVAYRNGKRLHETVIDRMQPNPKLPKSTFRRPAEPKGK